MALALAASGVLAACGLKGPLVQASPAEAASAAAIAASAAPPR